MESHYTSNLDVIYAVSRYRTKWDERDNLFRIPGFHSTNQDFILYRIQTGSPNSVTGQFPDGST